MAIEIVDFPINSMVIFQSYVAVYQRVIPTVDGRNLAPVDRWFIHVYPIIYRVSTIRLVVQDFFHPQYLPNMKDPRETMV